MSLAAAQPLSAPRIRVMVVDDSAVARGLMIRFLEADRAIEVVGRAMDGASALSELARVRPDVVVLDIEMPGMDGLTALPLILKTQPGVRVLMASTLTTRNARISLDALQAGASDYVPKPDGGALVRAEDFQRELVAKVKALGHASPLRCSNPSQGGPGAPMALAPRAVGPRPGVLLIGGSTGAPPVLMGIAAATAGVSQPILLTQHMPPTFTAMLAEQLQRASGRPTAEARDGEPVLAGRTYVAPGGLHMTVRRRGPTPVICLSDAPPEHFCRPAVDPMLRSAAEVWGPEALALIITGMGSDGAEGCRAVAGAGGRFAVQDEATSVVWGMPGAAARTGLASVVLPKDQLGPWLKQMAEAA